MYLIFDTETTGLPRNWKAPITDTDNWPRCVQIAWQLHDSMGVLIEHKDFLIKPDDFDIPYDAEKIHGISTDLAKLKGEKIIDVLNEFLKALSKTDFLVGQNVQFDINILACEFHRNGIDVSKLTKLKRLDTCTEKTALLCKIPGGRGGKFKLPKLIELHKFLFNETFEEAHNATADVEATTRCFFELIRLKHFSLDELLKDDDYYLEFSKSNPTSIEKIGLVHLNLKSENKKIQDNISESKTVEINVDESVEILKDAPFSHLHNHTQYSVLQSTIEIDDLINKAYDYKMPAVAITDISNLFGAYKFINSIYNHPANQEIIKYNKTSNSKKDFVLKGIIGSEIFVCKNHNDKTKKDNGNSQVFLVKNKKGYHNLSKMSSISYTDGFYYVPRIDKSIIEKYKDGLIALSGGLRGEIADLILNVGEKQAEESIIWWKENFKDDFYIEILRHGLEEEKRLNEVLIRLAKKHKIKIVACNDNYFINKEDANAHDILLCIRDAELQSTPKGKGRGYRFGLPNDEYYFKNQEQMKSLFYDIPEAIININHLIKKIENFHIKKDVVLPKFNIPEEFIKVNDDLNIGENNYLRHLTYEGAKKRYENITNEIQERIDFELKTIEKTGYPGYFLIVQDITSQARKMGVSVGPGRGSAAGSVVAYCIGITNVDPVKYDLLFERFLNPDRVSLPDIDIDFDDEGRSDIIKWVVEKYGKNQVAQIITFGTMAAKSSLRDTARVLDLPLSRADILAKKMPEIKLNKLFNFDDDELKDALNREQFQIAKAFKQISFEDNLESQTIKQATILEGSVRNTGIHACGLIITPEDISNLIPVTTSKDADLLVTQFDNSVVESAGMLKMDFLGLKNLTIIKDCCKIIKHNHGVEINPDDIDLNDAKTYELFQRGETNGIFQFESPGMQKNLRSLKPDKFDDLIAMNALYRPGPMEYIPTFIKRKHGVEKINYDLPEMEEYLSETYGVTVFQEQVMLLSQSLANFSKGDADVLRKAMGKKIFSLLNELKPKFLDGCKNNGHDEEIAEKIWKDWEAFAAYAFNKSHSTCYALIAFQTAYLKTHFPAEYMAAYLTHNMNDIKKVTFYMEECRRMGIKVLGPDINESFYKFAVNKNGEIRFGLGAVKGLGQSAVETIVNERLENGEFLSIFDVAKRIDLRAANKRAFESLVLSGGFDSFGFYRSAYFNTNDDGSIFLEKILKFGSKYQSNKNSLQVSLFSNDSDISLLEPEFPKCEPWDTIYMLNREKEVVGFYISGHPLNDYRIEMEYFCSHNISHLKSFEKYKGKSISIGGIVTNVEHRFTKNGKPFGTLTLEDYDDSFTFYLFGEDYPKYKSYMNEGWFLYLDCRVQERKWQNNELELKIVSLELLSEIKEKTMRSINLKIDIQNISDKLLDNIFNLISKNEGKHKLKFCILDFQESYNLNFRSKKFKISLNKEFINSLKEMPELDLEIN